MDKPCERCVYATGVPHSGLYCARPGGWYRCEDERTLSWVPAVAYGACGARGRFFTARLQVPAEPRVIMPVAGAAGPIRPQA